MIIDNDSNIFKEGELQKEATVQDFLTVQNEGERQVTRIVRYYNLDVINLQMDESKEYDRLFG